MDNLSEKDEKFAYNYLSNRETYHHQKEQMAYIGFLVQTAFLTAIMTLNWKSDNLGVAPELMLIIAVPFWAILHVFVRWQLRLRRYAAVQCAAILNALLKNLEEDTEVITVNESPKENAANKIKLWLRKLWNKILIFPCILIKMKWWQSLVDTYFWPCPSVFPFTDTDISKFPNWYQNEFKVQIENKGTGAIYGEILITLASYLILISIIFSLTVLF